MDAKKKIKDLYDSDKKGRGERVVIGLSGGLNSFVAAYLLKIQKYELFAVTVVTGVDAFGPDQDKYLSCFIDGPKLTAIKEFCQQLKIPHFQVKGTNEFQEEVVERWMGAKATGTFSNQCWNCHDLRMRLLHHKALELDAKFVATGHYAKLFHHEAHGTYYVHSSNDEEFDQSAYLSRLPHELLSVLKLPLSDLTRKEVIKLAENFGLEDQESKARKHECFPDNEVTLGFLQKAMPGRFLQEGEILSSDGASYGSHSGIIHQRYGEKVSLSGNRKEVFLSDYSSKEKEVIVSEAGYFLRKRILLVDCKVSEETSLQEPLKGVVRLSSKDSPDCWIYPNSLNGATLEWEVPIKVREGEMISVFIKRGKNAKVLLTGKVRFLEEDTIEEDQGEEIVQVHYGRDF